MKQWVLGAHNYHDALNEFPAAWNLCHGIQRSRWSAHYALLPFLEQSALFEGISSRTEADYTTPDAVVTGGSNVVNGNRIQWGSAAILNESVPTLQCPSDNHELYSTNGQTGAVITQAACNFMVSTGDGVNRVQQDDHTPLYSVTGGGSLTAPPIGPPARGDVSSRGMFYPRNPKSLSDVTDGTSNTIAISESVVAPASGTNFIRGGIAGIATGVDAGSWQWDPTPCMAVKRGKTFTGPTNPYRRGSRYLDGMHIYTLFSTAMPPNSPSCSKSVTSETDGGFYNANSNHTGGVNGGWVDGSVHFVSESIDTGGLPKIEQGLGAGFATGNFTGNFGIPSPYGVWGAMGTPASGEVVAVP
jgi:hypothetical protein